jgi:hypothetical protein
MIGDGVKSYAGVKFSGYTKSLLRKASTRSDRCAEDICELLCQEEKGKRRRKFPRLTGCGCPPWS